MTAMERMVNNVKATMEIIENKLSEKFSELAVKNDWKRHSRLA
jgi:hypothetical protein